MQGVILSDKTYSIVTAKSAALGASPWRLVRGLLIEGLVLSVTGACVGVALAYGGVHVLRAWLPSGLPRISAIAIDLRVLSTAATAAIMTGIFFGIVPAVHAAKPDLTNALKDGGRSATAGVMGQRLRSLLVVAEVAVAVVLLVGAGLFTGSFVKLTRIDPGFDYHDVLVLNVGLLLAPGRKFDDRFAARGAQYVRQVLDAVDRVPGVQMSAAVNGGLPLSGNWSRDDVELPGRGELKGDDDEIDRRSVTPNYLQLLHIPLRRGRYLADSDRAGSTPVVVINEAATRKYWPRQDALGQHITIDHKDRVVVGIVGDIRHLGPEARVRQECYIPLEQDHHVNAAIVIRTAGEPLAVLPAVKAAIWSINREQRLSGDLVTLDGYMDRLISQRRFNMAVLALFGVLGLVIAAVGIYGVMAYVVAQRINEIGVRMALGATRGNVVSMVLRRAGTLMIVGLAIGAVASWYLGAGIRTFLFEVQPNDGGIFAAALATLGLAGLIASIVPARRAATVDPLVALRHQ